MSPSEIATRDPVFRAGTVFRNGCHIAVRIHVTATRAVPEFADTVERVGIFIFLVRTRFEIICMARGTIRYVGGRRPCHCLAVGFMAGGAGKIAAVVSRIGG